MFSREKMGVLIFPHQLFLEHPALDYNLNIYLIEDQLFFSDPKYKINFHKKKLLLHRASMKYYQNILEKRGYNIHYVDYTKDLQMGYIFDMLQNDGIRKIICTELIDYSLKRRIQRQCLKRDIKILELDGPGFLTSSKKIKEDILPKKRTSDKSVSNHHYLMNSFYIKQRKNMDILVKQGNPEGGKWSFDYKNRKKIPEGTDIPQILDLKHYDKIYQEACVYVEEKFPQHTGDLEKFIYPLTHPQADIWLEDFIKNRLEYFGDYEDAIRRDETFLFHSILSSSLNIGLLTPLEVVEKINGTDVPLNSKEGFIRQIIGWREYMRGIYYLESLKQRTTNFMNHQKKLDKKLYWGRTTMEPYDEVVERVIKHAYCHHIERLMILGNLMFLLETDPDEVYRWFMEMFIDSYDWVMVPNVYGMSQYADGGIITSKPYLSSSNYIRKMSNYKKGEWTDIWDALFWTFMEKNRKLMSKNPRTALLLGNLKNKKKMEKHRKIAQTFKKTL